MFLIEGPRTASIGEGLGFLRLYHSYREGERYFRLVAELTQVPPDAHPAWAGPPGGFNGQVRGFGPRAPKASEILQLSVTFPSRYDSHLKHHVQGRAIRSKPAWVPRYPAFASQ